MEKLRFSIVTVTYNAESNIAKTITSVLNQTALPYEYIIVDGKSLDNTLKIIYSYQREFENRGVFFKVISEKDTGIYNAMNKGIDLATGEFIGFLNSGDWYELNALEIVNEIWHKDKFDLCYGSLNYYKPNGNFIIKKSKLDKLVSSRNWNHPSMFLRSKFYKKLKFNEQYKIYADFELYLKLRKLKNIKITVINKVITNFISGGVSTSGGFNSYLKRSKEKYLAYKTNGYGKVYLFETYGWEFLKYLFMKIYIH